MFTGLLNSMYSFLFGHQTFQSFDFSLIPSLESFYYIFQREIAKGRRDEIQELVNYYRADRGGLPLRKHKARIRERRRRLHRRERNR